MAVSTIFPILVAILIGAAAVALTLWGDVRSAGLIEAWATENRLTVLHREVRYFRRGPFFWSTSRNQTVHYVTVRDQSGHVRRAWVRCGGWFLGLFSRTTEARWDESPGL